MFHKLVALTVMLVALGGALLVQRQQRMEIANQTADLYWQIQRTRQAIWDVQGRSALLLRPAELEQRIRRAQLGLEPLDPAPPLNPRQTLVQHTTAGAFTEGATQ